MLAIVLTLVTFLYQDSTGPTEPIKRDFKTARGVVHTDFIRSENIGTDLTVMLLDPVPQGVTAQVKYRRYASADEYKTLPMAQMVATTERRGSTENVSGIGVRLPSLHERAGKYQYYVYISDGTGAPVSITGDAPIFARYKAAVPNSSRRPPHQNHRCS